MSLRVVLPGFAVPIFISVLAAIEFRKQFKKSIGNRLVQNVDIPCSELTSDMRLHIGVQLRVNFTLRHSHHSLRVRSLSATKRDPRDPVANRSVLRHAAPSTMLTRAC